MKKVYTIVAALALFISAAQAQCTIDPNNTTFFTPDVDNVPCAERNVAYNQTLQFYIPTSVDLADYGVPISYVLNTDSVVLDSITGFPAGLTWSSNPAGPVFYPGSNGCGLTSGTTTADTGNYPLTFHGLMYMSGQPFQGFFDGDTSIPIQLFIRSNQGRGYSIDVIEQGAPCRPVQSGINDFNADLNAALTVYPNPNNGVFQINLNAGSRVNGEIRVVDVTGRLVYNENIDVMGLYNTTINVSQFSKGIYTVQLRTANGFASKNISVE
jgi:hypothetical protein